jgi:glutathione S-transferase
VAILCTRIVRVVLDELGLDYERREEITTPTSESRAASTPTLQVPTFWDGDVHLWESGLIVEYLLSNYSAPTGESPPLAKSLVREI